MTIVLRYVNNKGFMRECFFDLVHVKDIGAMTLKKGIWVVLSQHHLDVQNILGQGYDGSSNIHNEWKGF